MVGAGVAALVKLEVPAKRSGASTVTMVGHKSACRSSVRAGYSKEGHGFGRGLHDELLVGLPCLKRA